MQYRRRLRSRIIVAFVVLGFGLTALFAVSTLMLRARLENQLVEDWLRSEARAFLEFKRLNPDPSAPYQLSVEQMENFAYRPDSPRIPLAWKDLPSGVYDMKEAYGGERDEDYKLVVEREHDIVTFIKYRYGRQVLGFQQLVIMLGTTVVVFTGLAWLLGVWMSRRVMRPVADLATQLRAFHGERKRPQLAPLFADDEVGQLAAALDDYADQLTERVTRDREFNADVSHELRTPLAVIRGATELLLAQPDLADKQRQRLKRIERATQQCADLTTALLMLSRNERGDGPTDVRKLAENLAEANRVNIGSKPVEIRVEGQQSVLVDAPEAVVSVALGNLITNACKYTPAGEVVVTVLGDRVEVVDTGPGISEEDAAHLFDRGYRGKSAEGSKGAGIGLAIVRRLCELYDWRVFIAPRRDLSGAIATLEFEPYRRVAAGPA
jgi:signal transduction histidine kinase